MFDEQVDNESYNDYAGKGGSTDDEPVVDGVVVEEDVEEVVDDGTTLGVVLGLDNLAEEAHCYGEELHAIYCHPDHRGLFHSILNPTEVPHEPADKPFRFCL